MNGTIELKKAIMINDKKVQKLKYDTDEITSELFAEAESKKMKASGSKGGNLSGAMELDYGLHLYLGFASIIAVNGDYAYEDLERVKGPDLIQITKVGRNFFNCIGRISGRQLRRAIRDYSRTFHTSTSELERKRVIDFIVEYAEAAEDLAAEQKRRQKSKPPQVLKHKKGRRR